MFVWNDCWICLQCKGSLFTSEEMESHTTNFVEVCSFQASLSPMDLRMKHKQRQNIDLERLLTDCPVDRTTSSVRLDWPTGKLNNTFSPVTERTVNKCHCDDNGEPWKSDIMWHLTFWKTNLQKLLNFYSFYWFILKSQLCYSIVIMFKCTIWSINWFAHCFLTVSLQDYLVCLLVCWFHKGKEPSRISNY